jgi:hypothetical protein
MGRSRCTSTAGSPRTILPRRCGVTRVWVGSIRSSVGLSTASAGFSHVAVGAREHPAPYLRTGQISAHAWCECRERHT